MEQPSKRKVYHDVLEELRTYIRKHQLSPGDKLPSERELALKLDAGRSSVREALRALELLGLIETRRGEGTFLRTYQTLQSVELLASFILLEDKTRDEIIQVKQLIEREAIKLAISQIDEASLAALKEIAEEEDSQEKHMTFFTQLFQQVNNKLLFKIWILLEEFTQAIDVELYKSRFYKEVVKIISTRDIPSIEQLYQ